MSKILLVEDDSSLAMGLKYLLENEGYELDIRDTVAQSKEIIDQKNYDLYLLDIGLPDGNGYELCQYIRVKNSNPIIFLTARDDEQDVVRGLEIGGDDYIIKPFRTKELVMRVKSALRRSSQNTTYSKLISGDVVIDQLQARVYVRGEEVFLTQSEYKLLLIYMNNAGKVISRIESLEILWDTDGDFINDASISVYIRRLREKIESVPSNPVYLKTSRGRGYIWSVEVTKA